MILLITTTEFDKNVGAKTPIVSHGIDEETGKSVVLPCVHPADLGAVYDKERREWILPDRQKIV